MQLNFNNNKHLQNNWTNNHRNYFKRLSGIHWNKSSKILCDWKYCCFFLANANSSIRPVL